MDRQNIFSNIIGTIIGIVIGFGIENFKTATPFQWLQIFILLLVFLFIYVYTGPLKFLLKSRGAYDIQGEWDSQWQYAKNGTTVIVIENLVIRQLGRHVSGIAESIRVTGNHPTSSLKWRFSANIIEGGGLVGTWRNIEKGKNYHGVIQGRIHPGGKKIEVLWLGNENDGVHTGSASWSRK